MYDQVAEGLTMRWQAVLAVMAAIIGMAISPAAAAQTEPGACAHTATILDAGDFLLAEPATFPNFWRDRFGDDAAYLKIRYGGLTYAEGTALLAGLGKTQSSAAAHRRTQACLCKNAGPGGDDCRHAAAAQSEVDCAAAWRICLACARHRGRRRLAAGRTGALAGVAMPVRRVETPSRHCAGAGRPR